MSLKSVRAEKGRLQGEDLLSESNGAFERGGVKGEGEARTVYFPSATMV